MGKEFGVSIVIKKKTKLGILEIEENFFNTIKGVFKGPKADIILNGQRPKAFPLRSGIRQGCPLSPLLFTNIQDVLVRTTGQEKELKGIYIGKEDVVSILLPDVY